VARPAKTIVVDDLTRRAQADASDPNASAWVSANAGAGKTYVLTRRVVRLLLAGVDPARILCLTFTKAAAAEMAKRVFARLSEWTRLDDAALAKELKEIEGRPPRPGELVTARRLFSRALETPGGQKIQTIHAFCERLLHLFPFEANVAGHFEVLDEQDQAALADAARRAVLAEAARNPEGALGKALAEALAHTSDLGLELAVADFVRKRDRVRAWIVAAGSVDAALAGLRTGLDLAPPETPETVRAALLAECTFSGDDLARLASLLREGGAKDRTAAERLAPCLAATAEDERIGAYLGFWQRGDGELRVAASLVSKAIKRQWPGLDEALDRERSRLKDMLDRIAAADCCASTAAMVRLSDAAINEYARQKQIRGVLDFEDLIVKTANLLTRPDASRWVQYKLDRGLDHILVDEAQDTSSRQWEVVRALVEEFFAGFGAGAATRTVFAVGDEKQSIFSFQGALPTWFSATRRALGEKARNASAGWSEPQLHLSFRSVPVVLQAVDEVFRPPEAHRGLSSDAVAPTHAAARRNAPGRVILWPMLEPAPKEEPKDWTEPVDHLGEKSPEVRLAERIARTIVAWRAGKEKIEATGEPLRAGNILILSRTRGAQSDAINRALKSRGIAIAGADRLAVTDHIAVMDLMALGRVMLLPEDDLSLAALLKSPLIGASEDDLFALAHGRGGTLWDALGLAAAGKRVPFVEARARLDEWRRLADHLDPHAFFARVLGPDGGRRRMLARLGTEADDVLDEFLAQALAYERAHIPSLEGFLAFLGAAKTEIRRDPDTQRDEVRVMTVHGAKGLEAEIVFLVDTGAMPVHPSHDPKIVSLRDDRDGSISPLVWMRSTKVMPKAVRQRVEALRELAREEYRRLLYVAMTRARDRLYVTGTLKERATDQVGGWYALVRKALESDCTQIETAEGPVLEWRRQPRTEPVRKNRPDCRCARRPRPGFRRQLRLRPSHRSASPRRP
jgi:ATP-dependent helicase/nuclease subunit A